MRTKLPLLLTMLTTLTIFVGCTSGRQSTKQLPGASPLQTAAPSTVTPPPSGVATAEGTMDSGGGNTLLGEPLEHYIIHPRELEAYKAGIKPLIEAKALEGSPLKRQLEYVLDKKTWYALPVELTKIPAEKIGSAVGTDQGILQDFNQVWIDQHNFDGLKSTESQSLLLMHELLMGIKLLRFDLRANCLIKSNGNTPQDFYCKETYPSVPRGKPSDLTAKDYAQIRAVAKKIMENGASFTLQNWTDLLGTEDFDEDYAPRPKPTIITANELADNLETSKRSQSWPKYGYDINKLIRYSLDLRASKKQPTSMDWNSDSTCDFDIEIKDGQLTIALNEDGKVTRYSGKTGTYQGNINKDFAVGLPLTDLWVGNLGATETLKKGDQALDASLAFAGPFLQVVKLTKVLCLSDECHESAGALNTFNKECRTDPSYKLNPTN